MKKIIMVNDLPVEIVRKDIKNVHLGVYPPLGKVRVSAPTQTRDEYIRLLVVSKLSWIKTQQMNFQSQLRETPREYISGESHYYFGKRYLLKINELPIHPKIVIRNKKYIELTINPNATLEQKENALKKRYRSELARKIPDLIEKWSAIMGVEPKERGIRQMKTGRGTCNVSSKHIQLNLELAKKPEQCLEYVIVSVLTRLLERHRNRRFEKYMDQFLPRWRHYKGLLNSEILKHETWKK